MLIEQRLAFNRGEALVLQIITAGIGRAAQQKSALAVVLEVGRDGIETHEGRQRHRVGAVTLKGFLGVLLGGAADVAAFGIQNDGNLRRGPAHVFHQAFELALGAVCGEVGNLRLEGQHQIGGGIDDGGAKIINLAGVAQKPAGEFGGLRVQAHAQQGVVLALCGAQHVEKGHVLIVRSPSVRARALAGSWPDTNRPRLWLCRPVGAAGNWRRRSRWFLPPAGYAPGP